MDEGTLNLESMDIADEKRRELLRLFPEAATDGGKIDFDQLKRALGETVDAGRERYGMNWPGKADCFRLIQSPSTATLLPVREESVRFDETENMIIEGDNLEVLKLLQKGYQGKVKMIYIDPPYNTGNDFIYPDDFADNLKNYLQYTGQVDAEGKKFSNNFEADGRFHSKWLNMMYPRLYLARNLLADNGLLFVSCDAAETANCRLLLEQVFGVENYVAQIIWKKSYGGGSKTKHVVVLHEYILCFCRRKDAIGRIELPADPKARRYYKLRDSKFERRGPYRLQPLATTSNDDRGNLRYAIPFEDEEIWPEKQWQWEKPRTLAALKNDDLVIIKQQNEWSVNYKQYLYDEDGVERGAKPFSILDGPYTQAGSSELADLFDGNQIFSFPKPSSLIQHLLQYANPDKDFFVLDFFAGSGSTAHATVQLNREDGGARKYILVQLPEPTRTPKDDATYEDSSASKAGYFDIADITKERMRRVIQLGEKQAEAKLDLQVEGQPLRKEGFRVFKLAPSNFKVWEAHTDEGVEGVQRQMELAVHHILPDRTAEDLFFEILMKSEYPLTAKVERFDAAGVAAYSVKDDELVICVERVVTEEAVNAIVKRKPSKVIFLDEAFSGNDQLKANAKMNFETAGVKRFETV